MSSIRDYTRRNGWYTTLFGNLAVGPEFQNFEETPDGFSPTARHDADALLGVYRTALDRIRRYAAALGLPQAQPWDYPEAQPFLAASYPNDELAELVRLDLLLWGEDRQLDQHLATSITHPAYEAFIDSLEEPFRPFHYVDAA